MEKVWTISKGFYRIKNQQMVFHNEYERHKKGYLLKFIIHGNTHYLSQKGVDQLVTVFEGVNPPDRINLAYPDCFIVDKAPVNTNLKIKRFSKEELKNYNTEMEEWKTLLSDLKNKDQYDSTPLGNVGQNYSEIPLVPSLSKKKESNNKQVTFNKSSYILENTEFLKKVDKVLISTKSLFIKKAKEYHKDGNAFHNFLSAAIVKKTSPEDALWGMSIKHLISLIDMVEGTTNGQKFTNKHIKEKTGDMINYLIILQIMMEHSNSIEDESNTE